MKISGKNLKRRLYGATRLRNRVARARYFRGHGVHSPFVYAIVRQVFMRSTPIGEPGPFYDRLCALQVPRKRALQLHNLCQHCGYTRLRIDEPAVGDFIVVLQETDPARFPDYAEVARQCGATLAILAPYQNRDRERACRALAEGHNGTTVDNRGYLLLFNNGLPKQHFRL